MKSKINSRSKGQRAEREIAHILNSLIIQQCEFYNSIPPAMPYVQRNQNQSAVGGCDLINTFNFSIEIKNCETLLLKKWWLQTTTQAKHNNKIPILLIRQNRKGWKFSDNGSDLKDINIFFNLFSNSVKNAIFNNLW